MKTLLVPTDFSTPAENAMLYAGHLAQRIDASIHLLHVYQIPISMNEVPVLTMPAEEMREAADGGLSKAKELLQKQFPSLQIHIESRLGDTIDELNEVCDDTFPLAIIVGKHGSSGIERFFFGNTSLAISRHSKVPVIVVPENFADHRLENIALAADADASHISEQKIRSVLEALPAQLHIVHVKTDQDANDPAPSVPGINATRTTIRDDEFVHGIESFVSEKQIDMIIIIPHKHSLIERMFFKTHTKELMEKIMVPVMCIPGELAS